MKVKKPLNINDEDIVDGMSRVEQPLSQPTVMSYSLVRIRVAEISRSIVDRSPLVMATSEGPSYETIMDIDTELQSLINDIPPFFSMSIDELIETYQLTPLRAKSIVHQGYMLYSLLYAQHCKLHLPYFSLGYVDSTYACSREICLQSARLIIQTESRVESSGLCTSTRYRFLGLLLAVFMANIVLLMDLCHTKSAPQQKKQRGELAEGFRMLEEARHESGTAARFLDSLTHVLRKYKVSPPTHSGQRSENTGTCSSQNSTAPSVSAMYDDTLVPPYSKPVPVSMNFASLEVLGSNWPSGVNRAVDTFANEEELPSYFNELAQNLEQGINVGNYDWDNIFSGLDSSFA